MIRWSLILHSLLLPFLIAPSLVAQESISGVINEYAQVVRIDHCKNMVVIDGPFRAEKLMRALLIQIDVLATPVRLVSVLTDGAFVVDSIMVSRFRCSEIILENVGDSTVTIPAMMLEQNITFSIPPAQMPLVIPSGERRSIRICFSPVASGVDRDTLGFSLDCHHRLALKGSGAGGPLAGDDDCGNGISVYVVGDMLRRFQASAPRPNPAAEHISIPILQSIPVGEPNGVVECDLYDQRGVHVATGRYTVTHQVGRDGISDESGMIDIDARDLPSGLYYVRLRSITGTLSWTVVKE